MTHVDYVAEYEKFMNAFKLSEVSGEEVGAIVMRMGGYYATYNIKLAAALKKISQVRAEIQNGPDPSTGKAMSTSKAEILSDATPEGLAYTEAKIHVQNIEQYINALKSLQKGVLQEYAHS